VPFRGFLLARVSGKLGVDALRTGTTTSLLVGSIGVEAPDGELAGVKAGEPRRLGIRGRGVIFA
jgi:hypothetical protein